MDTQKRALIFGTTGQVGSYLCDSLLLKNYKIFGAVRRCSANNRERLEHLKGVKNIEYIECDITDTSSIARAIKYAEPDEIYNLAAQSHVWTSFHEPAHTWEVTAKGVLNILESIKENVPSARFYQASSSEMFGKNFSVSEDGKFQNENTPFSPQSPYAIAKLAAHHFTRLYRESYGLFTCCGILFNHESERRGENFLSRKVTQYVADIHVSCKHKYQLENFTKLKLGNLDAYRDWGHAEDYVNAMWLMLQQPKPDDYVVATGQTQTVKTFVKDAFQCIGLNWEDYVEIDKSLYRPSEVDYLKGDASKARRVLKWEPTVSYEQLVERMVWSDINKRLQRPAVSSLEKSGISKRQESMSFSGM